LATAHSLATAIAKSRSRQLKTASFFLARVIFAICCLDKASPNHQLGSIAVHSKSVSNIVYDNTATIGKA